MKRYKRGFSTIEIAIVMIVIVLMGVVGWRAYVSMQSSDSSDSTTSQHDEAEIPEGWVRYENSEYGFSFAYPVEWGDAWVGEISYGSEKKAGPHRSIYFADCEDCDPSTDNPIPLIGITAKDFGGIGISRPLATAAGYARNSDGSFNIDKKVYAKDDTSELALINEVLFVRYSDAPWHDADFTIAVANLPNGGEYSGISFVASDNVGETENSDVLRSIVETYEAI